MSYYLKSFLLALLSSILLWIAWPPHHFGWVSFMAFVPLFFVHDFHKKGFIKSSAFRWLIYFSLLMWNIFTTWWVWLASPGGGVAAIVLNTLLMSIIWWVFDLVSRRTTIFWGYTFLISFWISYEFLHLNWDITWPWLVLGNVFANNTGLIQWYEFTGHLGGSLWVLLVNIFLFLSLKNYPNKTVFKKHILASFLLIIAPIIGSLGLTFLNLSKPADKAVTHHALIIQPNLDPYSEKFNSEGTALTSKQQLERMLQMAEENMKETTEFVVLPETAIQGGIHEPEINNESLINLLQGFVRRHPQSCILTGANSYILYPSKQTESARAYGEKGKYLDYFNSAFKIDTSSQIEIYHKSRLVPGVEKLPYPKIFGGLIHLLKLDAEAGGLGTQPEASVFSHHGIKVAPLICYESIFGGYVQQFVKKDANVLFVLTNDGWWGNTDGYKQHLDYGKLRCIEFRKELLQCANTGLSAQIDKNGVILQQTQWWKQEVLEAHFTPNNTKTFYAIYGDYLGWIGTVMGALVFLWLLIRSLLFKNNATFYVS